MSDPEQDRLFAASRDAFIKASDAFELVLIPGTTEFEHWQKCMKAATEANAELMRYLVRQPLTPPTAELPDSK